MHGPVDVAVETGRWMTHSRCGHVAARACDRVGRYAYTCVKHVGHDGDHQYRWEPVDDIAGRAGAGARRAFEPTDTRGRARDAFEQLVIADAFGRTTDVVSARLRSDTQLEQFYSTLVRLVETLDGQLAVYKARVAAGDRGNPDWRRRTLTLRYRLAGRIRELKPAVKALRRRQAGERDR